MEVKLSRNVTVEWDENDYKFLIREVKKMLPNSRIFVGSFGDAVITEYNPYNPYRILAHLVHEEDGTVSWQLLPDEHSDYVITNVTIIPYEEYKLNEIRADLLSIIRVLLEENEVAVYVVAGYLMGLSYSGGEFDLHIQNLIDNVKSFLEEDIVELLSRLENRLENKEENK